MEMVSENIIFEREEITRENSIQLSKLFLRTLAIYDQVKAAGIRGDYSFEQHFYSPADDLDYSSKSNNESEKREIIINNNKNIVLGRVDTILIPKLYTQRPERPETSRPTCHSGSPTAETP